MGRTVKFTFRMATGNSRIVEFDHSGNFIRAWGKYGTGPGEFNLPHSVVVDAQGKVYVGDRENKRIQFSMRTDII